MARRVATIASLLSLTVCTILLAFFRLWPVDQTHRSRYEMVALACAATGLLAALVQAVSAVMQLPPRRQRLSGATHVQKAWQLVAMESGARISAELAQCEPLDEELFDLHWQPQGTQEGAVATVGSLADRIIAGKVRRLLITGRPGSGKTTLALLLADHLRPTELTEPDRPVPVVFSVASWAGNHRAFEDWLVQELAREHNLADPTEYGESAAARLVTTGRILPVLDGVDELSREARLRISWYLNHLPSTRQVIVVSSRRSLTGDSRTRVPILPTVELRPLSPAVALRHLERSDPAWAQARQTPHLAEELSTPLKLSLALAVATADGGPQRLMTARTQAELREELLDRYVPSVFAKARERWETTSEAVRRHTRRQPVAAWPPGAIRGWVRSLARIETDDAHQEIAWWRLWSVQPGGTRTLALAAASLLPVVTLLAVLTFGTTQPLLTAVVCVVNTLGVAQNLRRPMLAATLNAPLELQPELDLGFGVGTLFGVSVAYAVTQAANLAVGLVAFPIAAYVVILVARQAQPPLVHGHLALEPSRLLRRLQATSLLGSACYVVATLFVLTLGIRMLPSWWSWLYPNAVAFAVAAGFVPLRMSSWGSYFAVVADAALRRQLPWRLSRFLNDCLAVGVLRRSGPAYRFRSDALRAHLVAGPASQPRTDDGDGRQPADPANCSARRREGRGLNNRSA